MSCFICDAKCEPWILLENANIYTDKENKPIGKTIQTCGYSCCIKLTPKLPNNYGKLVLNKEDFCYWAVPVLPNNFKEFEFLTFEEIQDLDDSSKNDYYQQRENNLMDDITISDLYNELEREDELTYRIENNETGSETDWDDY